MPIFQVVKKNVDNKKEVILADYFIHNTYQSTLFA